MMNLKRNIIKIGHLAMMSLLLVAFTSCLSDNLEPCPEEGPGLSQLPGSEDMPDDGNIFLQLKVYLPKTTGTRSATEDDGSSDENPDNKPGEQNENTVEKAIIYFYHDVETPTLNYQPFLCMFQLTKIPQSTGTTTFTLRTQVKPEDLKSLAGKKVKVYVGANYINHIFPTDPDGKGVEKEWDPRGAYFNFSGINADPLGSFGSDGKGKLMPLASADEYKLDFTDLSEEAAENKEKMAEYLAKLFANNDNNHTLDLSEKYKSENEDSDGTLVLERCVARVDFKPNSGEEDNKKLKENIYPVGKINNLYAKMVSMQVFNVQKNSNLFRVTSPGDKDGATYDPTGDPTGGFTFKMLGKENGNSYFGQTKPSDWNDEEAIFDGTSYNWIACRKQDWEEKRKWTASNYNGASPGYVDYFYNQPLKNAAEPVYRVQNEDQGFTTISDLKDNISPIDGFYPWCYISENTPPSVEAMTKGLSTGIAFTMQLTDKDGKLLNRANFISPADYKSRIAEIEAAEKAEGADLDQLSAERVELNKKVIADIVNYKYNDAPTDYYKISISNQECYAKAVKDGGAVVGYEVIYYYFFRHNLSREHVLGVEEPMQFAVVRNNIYRISVTSLNALPVPFDPKEPAEPKQYYMTVDIKILAWVRRDITVGF